MSQNLLRHESSPYLLQHKDNPVHWRSWGQDVFEEAQRLDKPILLSIGYSACHWCHVMAHESFENPDIAGLMNELFVNVKVDREERPDVDQVYMTGLQALGGRGGWPLTAFLTPAGDLYWGGTYFPPAPRFGQPGFPEVLRQVEKAYRSDPERVAKNAARATAAALSGQIQSGAISFALNDDVFKTISVRLDPVNGGLLGAPKFPQGSLLEFLLRAADRTGEGAARDAFLLAMTRICMGGIYDHLGGGFARYSVDERWRVPHFEKMLYDNAQLIRLLSFAWKLSRRPLFAERIERTIAWLQREMLTDGGGFAASLNADSEGVEGKFYVWTKEEIEAALGKDDAAFMSAIFAVTDEGNWEDVNVLHRLDSAHVDIEGEARFLALREKLFSVRSGRIAPTRDDKALADWNGLAIEALAQAATTFGRNDWLDLARTAYGFLLREMVENDRVGHSARLGRVSRPGLSSDAANMVGAALSLFEATGERNFLDDARRLNAALFTHHFDEERGLLLTASDSADLANRPAGAHDDATPNPNAVAAQNLARLGILTGDSAFFDQAERLFHIFGGTVTQQPFWHLGVLNAFDFASRPIEAVIIGRDGQALIREVALAASPNLVLSRFAAADDAPAGSPAYGRPAVQGQATAYVCRERNCSLPIVNPDDLRAELARSN